MFFFGGGWGGGGGGGAAVDVSKYRDGRVHFRNSGLKGLFCNDGFVTYKYLQSFSEIMPDRFGPPADKKALIAYTNTIAPHQFAQPRVGLKSSLFLSFNKAPILSMRTAKILTSLRIRAGWSGSFLFAYVLRSHFSDSGPFNVALKNLPYLLNMLFEASTTIASCVNPVASDLDL